MLTKHGKSKNWYFQFQLFNKRYFGSTKTANKQLAIQVENKKKQEIIEQHHLGTPLNEITLSDAIDKYRKKSEGTANSKNVISHTNMLLGEVQAKNKVDKVKVFGFSGSKKMSSFTNADVERLIEARQEEQYSSSMIKHQLTHLKALIKIAGRNGFNVPKKIDYPRISVKKKQLRFLTIAEEQKLLAELDPQREGNGLVPLAKRRKEYQQTLNDVYDLTIFQLDLGLRIGEVGTLKWSDVNFTKNQIHITSHKADKESWMTMTKRLRAVVDRRYKLKKTGTIFTAKDGTARKYAPGSFKKACIRAGLPDVTSHVLRKTFATRLLQSGLAIQDVSALLHHSSIGLTLDHYAAVIPTDASKKAVDILDNLNTPKPGSVLVLNTTES